MSNLQLGPTGVLLTLSAFSFLLNGTFLIVICKSWKLVKRKRITYHVTNLAISDCAVGASTFCYHISLVAAGRITNLSLVFNRIAWMAVLTSLLSVCLMAIERAVCIKKPHTWKQILPLKRVLLVMVGNWVMALPLAILMYFYIYEMMFIFLVFFFIPITVTSVVYINMNMQIWKSSGVRGKTEQSSAPTTEGRRNHLLQQKVGSFVLILVLVLIISVSPSYFTLFVEVSCKLFKLNCNFIETLTKVQLYFYILAIMNHVVNPIFYAWRVSLYRQAFWQMFGRAGTENTQTYLSTNTI